ncbi:MAG TPA: substrate-binding domain-containing protein [Aggregatilineales bacterium]|nr:substrate-binding domain-containing protein [Aggregatilineales bacterium]
MKRIATLVAVLMVLVFVVGSTPAPAAQAQATKPLVMYMQMGGDPGMASVTARVSGAKQAAKDLNVELHEQYASWDPQKMIDQFKQAIAAKPDCIEIMGHPGEDAMGPLVDQAEAAGIEVTSGNNDMPTIEAKYQSVGFGYAGADLHAGGYRVGKALLAAGLKKGDKAMIYDIWNQQLRARSAQGIYDALTEAGVVVDKVPVTQDVDSDATKAIPIITAYLTAHPDLKAIGTQHGQITDILPKILKQAGKKPGDIMLTGIDIGADTIQGLKDGYIVAVFDQVLYLQGYYPLQQCVLTKTLKIPGLHIDTGISVATPQNIDAIIPLVQQGLR